MKLPYVICHMAPTIDGRIVTTDWPNSRTVTSAYERTAKTFDADAWIIGRISMEPYAGKARVPRTSRKMLREDFIARRAESYAIAIDPSGKLRWEQGDIDGEHVIAILSESVSDAYLAFLQAQGVSYLFGGRKEIDLEKVLTKLAEIFGIRRLLLEGGGKINGTFLAADLIDELSILVVPVADGRVGTPALFDVEQQKSKPRALKLVSSETLTGGVVWLRYKVKR